MQVNAQLFRRRSPVRHMFQLYTVFLVDQLYVIMCVNIMLCGSMCLEYYVPVENIILNCNSVFWINL